MAKISYLDSICPDAHKLQSKKIKKVIDSISDLPAIPTTFLRIRQTIEDPKSSVRDISNEIIKDQALTSKILKIANSAYYGFPRTISTVNEAVILMGFQKTWHLAMSVSMMNLFSEDSKIFNREAFWEHSVKVGLCAQIIAKAFRYPKPPELYSIGLMHDLGKLILDQYFHDNFIEIVTMVKEDSISFVDAENKVMGVSHPIIGAWLIERWNFPDFFLEGVALHHGEFTSSVSKIPYIIGLADNICLIKGIGFSYDKHLKEMNVKLINMLRLTEKQIEAIENSFDEAASRITVVEATDHEKGK